MKNLKKSTIVLLAAATVLLLTSVAGSTQAALTYFSEYYSAEVTVSNIGVQLNENGNPVNWKNYVSDGKWDVNAEAVELLDHVEGDIILGKDYDEELSVTNSGAIPAYVRVVIKKSWMNDEGQKDTTLSPDFIELGLTEGKGWVKDEASSTPERTVLYYTDILEVGEETAPFSETLGINEAIQTKVLKTTSTEVKDGKEYTTVFYDYQYDGYKFNVDVEVDAVQTHNAADAIKSAWGVDVTVGEDGSISLQ